MKYSSFYVNCDLFSSGNLIDNPADAYLRDRHANHVAFRSKLLQPAEIPSTQTLTGVASPPSFVTPSLQKAGVACAEDEKCQAVCRNARTGSTRLYYYGVKGRVDVDPDTESWRCLTMPGELKQGTQSCSSDLALKFDDVMKTSKIIKPYVTIPQKDPIFLLEKKMEITVPDDVVGDPDVYAEGVRPRFEPSLRDAEIKCQQDDSCEAYCYHDYTGRTLFYGDFDKAQIQLRGNSKDLAVSAKDEFWLGDDTALGLYSAGWKCKHVSRKCLKNYEKSQLEKHAKTLKMLESERKEYEMETKLMQQQNISRRVAPPLAENTFPVWIPKIPAGGTMKEWENSCHGLDLLLANSSLSSALPCHCPGMTFVKTRYGEWLQCCPQFDRPLCRRMTQVFQKGCAEVEKANDGEDRSNDKVGKKMNSAGKKTDSAGKRTDDADDKKNNEKNNGEHAKRRKQAGKIDKCMGEVICLRPSSEKGLVGDPNYRNEEDQNEVKDRSEGKDEGNEEDPNEGDEDGPTSKTVCFKPGPLRTSDDDSHRVFEVMSWMPPVSFPRSLRSTCRRYHRLERVQAFI